jgi:hypothetical protein
LNLIRAFQLCTDFSGLRAGRLIFNPAVPFFRQVPYAIAFGRSLFTKSPEAAQGIFVCGRAFHLAVQLAREFGLTLLGFVRDADSISVPANGESVAVRTRQPRLCSRRSPDNVAAAGRMVAVAADQESRRSVRREGLRMNAHLHESDVCD